MLFVAFFRHAKLGLLEDDHAYPFTKTIHSYLPKYNIPVYRNTAFLFTIFATLFFTDYSLHKFFNDVPFLNANEDL
jgi:hypothetical protein